MENLRKNTAVRDTAPVSSYFCFLCAAAYFISMPLSIIPIFEGVSLLKFVSVFSAAGLAAGLVIGDNYIRLNRAHAFIILYMTFCVFSLLILRNDEALTTFKALFETLILTLLITTRIYSAREREWFMSVWVLVGAVTTALMLSSSVQLANGTGRLTLAFAGGKEDPNQLCGYFILPILVCLERVTKKNTRVFMKILYLALVCLMLCVTFSTGSRGGLLAVLFTILAFAFLSIKGAANRVKMLGILIILGALFAFLIYPALPQGVAQRLSVSSVIEDGGSGRLAIWGAVWRAITGSFASLFIGNGLNSTVDVLADAGISNVVAHNHFLQVWCDQGLIGLTLFAALLISCIRRNFKRNRILALAVAGMAVLALTLTVYAYYKPFWNVLMMAAMNFEEASGNENQRGGDGV